MATTKIGIVRKVEQFKEDSRILTIEMKDSEPLGFTGGQFIFLNTQIPREAGKKVKRAFSIVSSDAQQYGIKLAVKQIKAGGGGEFVNQLQVNDEVEFSGPWGQFKLEEATVTDEPSLFIATDTGITALLGLLNGSNASPCLKQAKVLWLLEASDYFLTLELVEKLLPEALKNRVIVELIAPVNHSIRIEQAKAIVDREVSQQLPQRVMMVGDGDVIIALRQHLYEKGVKNEILVEPFFNNPKKKKKSVEPDNLRTGFTTGACSAAAAKAAARLIVMGKTFMEIESTLPNKDKVTFQLKRCELHDETSATCSIIKDAGDDPDCTDGAELVATVHLTKEEGIRLEGGDGVAMVTKQGLGLVVGKSAINPVPTKNITAMVQEELEGSPFRGALVVISVPGGQRMAEKTTNSRLGLVGGISILGTRGTVKPYSTAAYRASVIQAVKLAKYRGATEVVVTTGWRSENFAIAIHPHLEEEAFIQVGDFVGVSLRAIKKNGIQRAIIVGMIGKLSKMADGVTMTHQAGSMVNKELLASLAGKLGADPSVKDKILNANTARHILEICKEQGLDGLPRLICETTVNALTAYLKGGLEIHCYLTDFNGKILGQYPPENEIRRLEQ